MKIKGDYFKRLLVQFFVLRGRPGRLSFGSQAALASQSDRLNNKQIRLIRMQR